MTQALERWRPARGEFDRAAAAHLLGRAGLGISRQQLERAVVNGLDATLDALFEEPEHDPTLLTSIDLLLGTGSIESLQAWWMALMLGGRAPLRERLTLFWHDHFATAWDKVRDTRLMHRQNALFRKHGSGDFRVLLREVARDPAMLVWLDGNSNRKGHANENFAREVMELFALGIGNYSERDVSEAARAFTGWGVDGRRFRFAAADHDGGEKNLFGKVGRWDGDRALELILAQPVCARHVCRSLLQEYGGSAPTAAEVEPLAAELVRNDWNIAPVLRTILSSRWFFAPERRACRIAGPVELVVRVQARLELSLAPARAAAACESMGQALFRPPSVKGWDGGRAWINAGTWLARHEYMVELAREAARDERAEAMARELASEHAVECGSLAPVEAMATILTSPQFHLA
ncbi:MAG: DUF1800 domain-containing protein [Planctomycetes bacterium]|nr:DUF1800 domain-containing protein [Planctomycetota bacterium]